MRPLVGHLVAFTLFLASPAVGADATDAAGRIDFNDTGGSCSGALVAPGIVATAAHCTPWPTDDETPLNVDFVAGNGYGRAAVAGATRHPMYDIDHQKIEWKLRFDIGVVILDEPDRLGDVTPFPLGEDAQEGETLFIVSWLRGQGARPRQRACPVLSTTVMGLVTLGCPVIGGESGAPVLRKTDTGLELVAIISSRTRLLDQPVAQASNVRLRLPPLIDEILNETGS